MFAAVHRSALAAIALAAAFAWPSFATSQQAGSPADDALFLFRRATLIDGTGRPPRVGMDVLVKGERIVATFPDSELDAATAAKARVIPVAGRFLIPGLIDSHVHLATPPSRRQAEAILRRDLYGGVTAVRDMADDLRAVGELARASRVGEIAAPDIYYAALMAGPDFFTDPRTRQTTAGAIPGHAPWMQAVSPETDLVTAVAQAKGTSATAIKLYADLDAKLAARITAEAHRQQLLVWSHATLYPARPSEVVEAGVDAISHACLLVRETQAHVPAWAEPHTPVPLDAFRSGNNTALAPLFVTMARRGTVLDATIWTFSPEAAGPSSSMPLPPGSCDDVIGGAITGQAYRAGVLVSAGTDNLAAWSDPWPDLFHELAMLKYKAGLSNQAVFQAATATGARAAGQQQDMGTIEPGKLANMVVLARDPLESIENYKSVVFTVKRGRIFRRSAFAPLKAADIVNP